MNYIMKNCLILIFLSTRALSSTVVSLCEGESQELQCVRGKTISITVVFYGRSEEQKCPYERSLGFPPHNCNVSDADTVVKKICDTKESCSLQASSHIFRDDVCIGVLKVLEVEYQCVRGQSSHILPNLPGEEKCKEFVEKGIALPTSMPGMMVTRNCPGQPGLTMTWQCGFNPVVWVRRHDLNYCTSQSEYDLNQQKTAGNGTRGSTKEDMMGHLDLDEHDLFGNRIDPEWNDLDITFEQTVFEAPKISRDINPEIEVSMLSEEEKEKEERENDEQNEIKDVVEEREKLDETNEEAQENEEKVKEDEEETLVENTEVKEIEETNEGLELELEEESQGIDVEIEQTEENDEKDIEANEDEMVESEGGTEESEKSE